MADATLTQLVTRALEKLHVLRAGEVADTEDDVLVRRVIASVNEKLREMEIAYWTDTAIPQTVLEDLALYIACHLAHDFLGDRAEQFVQINKEMSLRELRRLTSSKERVYRPTRADYF